MMDVVLTNLTKIINIMQGYNQCEFKNLRPWGDVWHIVFEFEGGFRNKGGRELQHFLNELSDLQVFHSLSFYSDGTVTVIAHKGREPKSKLEGDKDESTR